MNDQQLQVRMMTDTHGATNERSATQAHVPVFSVRDLSVFYGDFRAVRDAELDIYEREITAFIGPSGCGKTTLLRCFNRMNDFIESARVEGEIKYHGVDLYDPAVNSTEVRRRIGMVFQKPNPFPKSIFDNVAYGPRSSARRARPSSPRSSRCRSVAQLCGTRSKTA